MIISFGSRETEKIWNGARVKNLPHEIHQIGRRNGVEEADAFRY